MVCAKALLDPSSRARVWGSVPTLSRTRGARTPMTSPKFETLVDIFLQSIASFGPRPLFGEKKNGQWSWMTYIQFGQMVDDLRGGLAQLGVTHGDRVAVIANNR